MGELQERITSTQGGLGHLGAGDLRAGRRPHRPGAGVGVRPPERDHGALAGARRAGDLPRGGPARLDLDDPQAGHPRRGALPHRDRGPGDAAALQGAAGHHRHPRHRRALRRGQADRGAGAQDPALPLAAVLRRRAVHRARGRVRPGRGDRARLRARSSRASTTRSPSAPSTCRASIDQVLRGGPGHARAPTPSRRRSGWPTAGPHPARARSSPPRARSSTATWSSSRPGPPPARSASSPITCP